MVNTATVLALSGALLLGGCDNRKEIDGVTYGVYGLANQAEMQNPKIRYQVSVGSVVVAVIFWETVVVPVYVLLWDLYEPVGVEQGSCGIKGAVDCTK